MKFPEVSSFRRTAYRVGASGCGSTLAPQDDFHIRRRCICLALVHCPHLHMLLQTCCSTAKVLIKALVSIQQIRGFAFSGTQPGEDDPNYRLYLLYCLSPLLDCQGKGYKMARLRGLLKSLFLRPLSQPDYYFASNFFSTEYMGCEELVERSSLSLQWNAIDT